MRLVTTEGELARRGFAEPGKAADVVRHLESLHYDGLPALVDMAGDAIDPDQALVMLSALLAADPERVHSLVLDPAFARRVVGVLGASSELARWLVARPVDVAALEGPPVRVGAQELSRRLLDAVGADPSALPLRTTAPAGSDELRHAYRRELTRIAARDVTSSDPLADLPDIAAELADLADAAVQAALAIGRGQVRDEHKVRLAVLALGKTGAQELNYISDVDVLYVAEPALDQDGIPLCGADEAVAIGSRLAGALTRACSDHTGAGSLWPVDAALRPEGKAGPLVRTLSSMAAYYEKWAKNWEFQAMLKARPMAGDLDLGQRFVEMVEPLIWAAGERPDFLAGTQAMRQRVISLIPAREVDREIKLGPGGLRDTEFSVQLLQLVHGRADHRLRERGTLAGLQALIDHGYVGRTDGAKLAEAYRFQRLLEHRVQLFRMRRTHLVPDDEPSLRRLARAVGAASSVEVVERWRSSARTVQRLQRRLFYSPLLEAVARIPSEGIRLTPDAAITRLKALGYADPAAALRHIQALSTGMTRQAEIQRQLLPAMLGWFAEGPSPDHGLLSFRQVSEALGSSPWYLRALRDEGAMAERMARILSSSRYVVDLLRRSPETVGMLRSGEEIGARTREALHDEMAATLSRHATSEGAIAAVRAVRRRELVRVAMADILHAADVNLVGEGLTNVADASVSAALEIACREVEAAPRIAVIGMGRWGGCEMSYASDADALFVVEDTDDPDALKVATGVITRARALLRLPGPDPALELDADLRPEGKGGPLVRTLGSYKAYYERWASTWEAQALLRASVGAGDVELTDQFCAAIDPFRYPDGGLGRAKVMEIRKLKARMEHERMPRGVDPSRHVKLGLGGLSDVEWTVQLVQLQHGFEVAGLRTSRTLPALRAAVDAGLVRPADAEALEAAWTMASRIRNTSMLVRGRASDVIPADAREAAQVAEMMGYPRGGSSHLLDAWRKTARHARSVADRLFWGLEE